MAEFGIKSAIRYLGGTMQSQRTLSAAAKSPNERNLIIGQRTKPSDQLVGETPMNSNEDRDLLRRSLGATNALISAMVSAQCSNTGYHWLNSNSFKNFAQRYMVIINQLPKGFCSPLNLIRYDTDAMPGPPRSTASYQRTVFESVYADLLVLRSYIENAIGSTPTAMNDEHSQTFFSRACAPKGCGGTPSQTRHVGGTKGNEKEVQEPGGGTVDTSLDLGHALGQVQKSGQKNMTGSPAMRAVQRATAPPWGRKVSGKRQKNFSIVLRFRSFPVDLQAKRYEIKLIMGVQVPAPR